LEELSVYRIDWYAADSIFGKFKGELAGFDRRDVAPDDLRPLYVEKDWPAAAAAAVVGEELGVSGNVVLRSAHSGGLPVVREAFLARLRRTIFC
jgi:hypothetical protein